MLQNLRSRTTARPSGKFHGAPRLGVQRDREQMYRGFHFRIWHAQAGVASTHARYSLRITDMAGAPRHYYSGYRSVADAERSARAWVDQAESQARKVRRDGAHAIRRTS